MNGSLIDRIIHPPTCTIAGQVSSVTSNSGVFFDLTLRKWLSFGHLSVGEYRTVFLRLTEGNALDSPAYPCPYRVPTDFSEYADQRPTLYWQELETGIEPSMEASLKRLDDEGLQGETSSCTAFPSNPLSTPLKARGGFDCDGHTWSARARSRPNNSRVDSRVHNNAGPNRPNTSSVDNQSELWWKDQLFVFKKAPIGVGKQCSVEFTALNDRADDVGI